MGVEIKVVVSAELEETVRQQIKAELTPDIIQEAVNDYISGKNFNIRQMLRTELGLKERYYELLNTKVADLTDEDFFIISLFRQVR